jgi:hypothetical protein
MPASPVESGPSSEEESAPDTAEIESALATARQDTPPQQRIEALRWLGQNATPEHFDALIQIQIQAPTPELRREAEAAVNALTSRFLHHPWPGVPQNQDPFEYMRDAPAPGSP